jgi:hypothetical protein
MHGIETRKGRTGMWAVSDAGLPFGRPLPVYARLQLSSDHFTLEAAAMRAKPKR